MLKVLVLWLFFVATHAWGQVAPADVTVAQLSAAVDQVSSSLPEGDPQRAALLKSYAETRAALDSYAEFNQAFKDFARSPSQCRKDSCPHR